jgi:putative endonuclease
MAGFLYILASRRHGTLYIGVTTDLPKRIWEHREGVVPGFTKRYGLKRLVYVETYDDISDAIVREKRTKEWRRDWKIELIERHNPDWNDLAVALLGFERLPDRPIPFRHPGGSRDPWTRGW